MLKIGSIVKVSSIHYPFKEYNGEIGEIIKEGKDFKNALMFTVETRPRKNKLLLYPDEMEEVNE